MRINESEQDNLIQVEKFTLEEKISLLSSKTPFSLQGIARLGIPPINITTSTKGYIKSGQGGYTNFKKYDLTCFPSFSLASCSFNRELLIELGEAIAKEYLSNEISTYLVSCSVLDSPYYGRGYELFGEDPFVVGELVSAFVVGLQTYGVGAILTDFLLYAGEENNLIYIDDVYLYERYLKPFKTVITKANPLGVMVLPEVINDEPLYSSPLLGKLKEDFSFNGIILSDWGGIADRVSSLKAGVHIELPSSGCFDEDIKKAIEDGTLDMETIDSMVHDIVNFIDISKKNRVNGYQYDKTYNHRLAEKVAEESIVLLKNEGNILPLNPSSTIAVLGNALQPTIQGEGSSYIPVSIIDDPLYSMREISPSLTGSNILYSEGYDKYTSEVRRELIYEACRTVMNADVVVMFLGFDENSVTEESDYQSLELPLNQVDLIDSVLQYNKNIVVVLNTPTCIRMPWIDKVKAVIDAKIPGEAFGPAIANILFGIANPSGKLSMAFPELFPFGYGLSYTEFEYKDIYLNYLEKEDTYQISFVLENLGDVPGKEVVFLYAQMADNMSMYKKLVGFCKASLTPKEKKRIIFRIPKKDLAIYNPTQEKETVLSGAYNFLVSASEQDVRLKVTTYVEGDIQEEEAFTLPEKRVEIKREEQKDFFTLDSTINELFANRNGKRLYRVCYKWARKHMGLNIDNPTFNLNLHMFLNTPLRKLALMSEGKLSLKKAQGIVDVCNGKPVKGVSKMLFK